MSLSLWFRHDGELTPIEIDSSATINDLYQRIGQEVNRNNFRLTFAGNPIDKDRGSLADIGLSNEAVIDIISEIPIWESMQRTFGDILVNRESVEWWKAAEQCRLSPHLESCSDEAICNSSVWTAYDFIECQNGKVHRIKMDRATPFKLRGSLSLDDIPRTVQLISLLQKSIGTVDFKGLSNGKSLIILDLHENRISELNLKDLDGSSLEMLYLYSNEISGTFDLSDLKGSNLKELYLTGNNITAITFGDMTGCSLVALDVAMNPIRTIDFGRIKQSKLNYLNWNLFEADRHLLHRVERISELKEAGIVGGGAYDYLTEHHQHVLRDTTALQEPAEQPEAVILEISRPEISVFMIISVFLFVKHVLRAQ